MNKLFQSKTLYVSVLVCSFNGGEHINDCLESLNGQTYGKENFEIIVVDDGSTDDTSSIAQIHGAHVIRFEKNRGIPVARNAGLFSAKGDIAVFIDDDCVADSHWLENLVSVFKDQTIVAVGGKIIALSRTTISERYMEAICYGNAMRLSQNSPDNLGSRLIAYYAAMMSPIIFSREIVNVSAIYTANAAYRKEALLKIGGFDKTLKTSEDTDVSARLIVDSGGRMVYAPNAIVRHRHYKKLFYVIRESFLRARYTLQFYLKNKKIPPIFPMPALYLFFLFTDLFFNRHLSEFIIAMILLPLVLYGWWIIRWIRERRLEYIWYAYIQLAVESAVLIGLLRGLVIILVHYIFVSRSALSLKKLKQ